MAMMCLDEARRRAQEEADKQQIGMCVYRTVAKRIVIGPTNEQVDNYAVMHYPSGQLLGESVVAICYPQP